MNSKDDMETKALVDAYNLLDLLDQSLIVVDRDKNIVFHNQPASDLHELLEFPSSEHSDELVSLVPETSAARMSHFIDEVFTTGEGQTSAVEIKTKTGRTVFAESRYTPLRVQDVITYVCITTRDVSQQKIFETRLRAAGDELSGLIEKANAIILSIDSRGYITEWNGQCVSVLGYTKDEAYTVQFIDQMVPEPYRDDFRQLVTQVLNGTAITNEEMTLLTNTGRIRTVLLSLTPRVNAMGNAIGIFLIGQDISELIDYRRSLERKVEQRTQELMKALEKEKEITELKGRFVSIASHEFRTPLSSIMMAAEQVKKNFSRLSKENIEAKMDAIVKNVNHMTALLDDVLTLSKSEAPRISITLGEIYLHNFLHELAQEVRNSFHQTHDVVLNFKADPGFVLLSDEKLLRSVIINLFSNAIKYSPGKTSIQVDVRQENDELFITVQDNGIGIEEKELNSIFEPFKRAGNVHKIQGTGLGLSIVKKAVDLLNGQIMVESELGAGTRFVVVLPVIRNN